MKPYKDRIVDEADGKARYNLVNRDGAIVAENVLVEITSPLLQEGDKFGAKEINLLLDRADNGTITAKFYNKAEAATKSEVTAVQNTANSAKSTADSAQGMANTAKSTADTAQNTANTAKSTADTAVSKADSAQNTANAALPKTGGELSGSILVQNYLRLYSGVVKGIRGGVISGEVEHGLILESYNQEVWCVGSLFPAEYEHLYNLGSPNYRWNTLYTVNNPNVSCDSKGKVLIANVDYSGVKSKGRSNVGSIPIEDLRTLIKELEIREYHRYKAVIDEDAEPQIITTTNDESEETTQEMPTYKQVVDTEHKELGIFIDDLKDNKYFDLLGRITKNEETGEISYSMDTGSYATLALAGAKDALNRLDAVEQENTALKQLLVSKGIATKEEIEGLQTKG